MKVLLASLHPERRRAGRGRGSRASPGRGPSARAGSSCRWQTAAERHALGGRERHALGGRARGTRWERERKIETTGKKRERERERTTHSILLFFSLWKDQRELMMKDC